MDSKETTRSDKTLQDFFSKIYNMPNQDTKKTRHRE